MELQELTVEELASLISPSSEAHQELRARGVLRTKNVVGELGEYYAIEFYNNTPKLPNLSLAPPGVQNIDAQGDTQIIKASLPLAESFGYANDLRSLSQGRAGYSMEFDSYMEAPESVVESQAV